jgi:hypothetical protein
VGHTDIESAITKDVAANIRNSYIICRERGYVWLMINDVFPQAIEVKEPHDVPLYNCTWAFGDISSLSADGNG